jgi:protein-tyrosine phosphatase
MTNDHLSGSLTDIHNHLVPAVDDGAQSMDESIRHLRMLFAEGVTNLSVSPHLFGWLTDEPGALGKRLDRLESAFAELEQVCNRRVDVPRLFFGQEILCPTPQIATRVFEEQRAGYRGTDYALVEFGFDLPSDVIGVIRAVLDSGRRILISHPERYRRIRANVHIDELRSWHEAGALLQVNAGSLVGDYGSAIEQLAWQLLKDGLAHVISTDHHADSRVVSLRSAYQAIVARGGRETARVLLSENTSRVLRNDVLVEVPKLPS